MGRRIIPGAPFIWFLYMSILAAALMTALNVGLPFEKLKLVLMSWFGAFVCLFLFLIQLRGIYYHLIPALVFLLTGLALLMHEIAQRYFGKRRLLTVMIILLTLFAADELRAAKTTALRHADYAQNAFGATDRRLRASLQLSCFQREYRKRFRDQFLYRRNARFPVFLALVAAHAGGGYG